jgi:hypothetical protein
MIHLSAAIRQIEQTAAARDGRNDVMPAAKRTNLGRDASLPSNALASAASPTQAAWSLGAGMDNGIMYKRIRPRPALYR